MIELMNTALQLLALLLMMFCALQGVSWLVIKRWPRVLLSENELLSIDYLSRFDGEFKPFITDWFDLRDVDWKTFDAEFRVLISRGGHIYSPFVDVRHPEHSGSLFNIHAAGFRHVENQGPWPISSEFFNIFFFGGSTTVHVGPDWASIPSRLQAALEDQRIKGRPVRVYNFGCGSYFSTQERILFQQLLLESKPPDMAIFLDGMNDFFFFDGSPSIAGFFRHALDSHNLETNDKLRNKIAAAPRWRSLVDYFWSLPLCRIIESIGEARAKSGAEAHVVPYRPIDVDSATLKPALERYIANKRQIEVLSDLYDIELLFVWQPVPGYKYDLKNHIALSQHYGLGGHERSGTGYTMLAEHLKREPFGSNFLWLADIQENQTEPLYLDNVHYTANFGRTIADHISGKVLKMLAE